MRKYFDGICPVTGEIIAPGQPVAVILDATFFSRCDGVLVARADGRNLLWAEIATENTGHYGEMADALAYAGVRFSAFVIDGRRGVRQKLMGKYPDVPIQQCQFHQIQTVTRYLSTRPKTEAGRELRRIALTLARTDRETLAGKLGEWHSKWGEFLREKSPNRMTGKPSFTHRRLRSAYRSLASNLPWLFTCLEHPGLGIPNTTNSCDGSFAHWKNKLRVHRGLSGERRRKMMNYFLENS